MNRSWKIWAMTMALLLLLSGCGDRVVIDRGGISKERDVMIAEAGENTRLMEETAGFTE